MRLSMSESDKDQSDVEQEMTNVAILHDIVLAFHSQFTRLANLFLDFGTFPGLPACKLRRG